jgi:hypothetical protein
LNLESEGPERAYLQSYSHRLRGLLDPVFAGYSNEDRKKKKKKEIVTVCPDNKTPSDPRHPLLYPISGTSQSQSSTNPFYTIYPIY